MFDAAPLEITLSLAALLLALSLRPWRLLQGRPSLGLPLFVISLILPLLWSLPFLLPAKSIAPHWSAAPLAVLVLGWPVALPLFLFSGFLVFALTSADATATWQLIFWQGVLPGSLALIPGWLVRRFAPPNLFFYTLGRGFIGTVLSVYAAYVLAHYWGVPLLNLRDTSLSLIGLWLMSWGDGVVTGMLTSVFAVYKPEWLATWADKLYIPDDRPAPAPEIRHE